MVRGAKRGWKSTEKPLKGAFGEKNAGGNSRGAFLGGA